ncbi:MAG: hypothetical protein J3Q66DRAFT_160772 [Benniella sp.]|nr:MAG: hypothetical protein J3Q66DRAFT_160772 [Benniella sp.]
MGGGYADNLSNGVNNMHVNQNPSISSPPLGPTRGGFGASLSSAPSTASSGKVSPQVIEESLNDPQLQGHPSTWSIDQVAYWLRWIGYDNVVGSFVDNEISGAILLELNLNNLKELEITSFGKRFNIMNAITTLKQVTKSDKGSKGYSGSNSGNMYSGGSGPNIPPRMESAGGPSPRGSYDHRGEHMNDPRHNYQDPRNAPMSPGSMQSPTMRHQQSSDYDPYSRNPPLTRSDTIGSASGGSMGDGPGPRNSQRQSGTSGYSSPSGQRGQWDRNAPRAPQVRSPEPPQSHEPNSHPDDQAYGARAMEQPVDQYPRPMDRLPGLPGNDLHHHELYPSQYEEPGSDRNLHVPDSRNRQMNGKANPNDKVVSLERIGKPDYAGWLKKKGDTYKTWKSRWFMLKGVTLYYMNSPKDNASKDYINLVGYKIIQDENIYAGKYCFKAVHDELRNFYFYTESEHDMKGWLKALMKVTIGRDPTAPVISSSNIATVSLHVARKMAPRPPSPSRRNRPIGPPRTQAQQQQHQQQLLLLQQQHQQQLQLQQQMLQQQHDQKHQQDLKNQHQQRQQQQHQQQHQQHQQHQMLDYDDEDSDGEGYAQDEYGGSNQRINQGMGGANNMQSQNHSQGSPIPQHSPQHKQQQRHSFVQNDDGNQSNDDDPWRGEDEETYGQQQQQQQQQQQPAHSLHQQQHLKNLRPDSEVDSFHRHDSQSSARQSPLHRRGQWTQEQYVDWINCNLPESVGPVSDMIDSMRSGVVLVRLVEHLSGEQVDKKIPNATYTLQMLENLLTAFKFMDRVGISTEGYTVKDIFNGNEDKITQMFDNIRSRFPGDGPMGSQQNYLNGGGSQTSGRSPNLANTSQHRLQTQRTGESEYEALYDEAARSTSG